MPEIDLPLFRKNIQKIYHHWQQDVELSDLSAIVFYVNDEDSPIQMRKGEDIQHWLFGVEFKSVIFVLTQNQFLILTSQTKVNFLKPLIEAKNNFSPEVVLLTRNKQSESENYERLICAIRSSGNGSSVGVLYSDKPTCKFVSDFDSLVSTKFTKQGFDTILSLSMLKKDASDIENIKNASKINSDLYKQTKNILYKLIEEKKDLKNSELSAQLLEFMQSDEFENKHADLAGRFDACHDPLIQSGGKLQNLLLDDFKSSKKPLMLNSIIITLSSTYRYHFSTMIRTIFVNPCPSKEENYKFALELLDHITNTLMKPGNALNYISEQAIAYVNERRPELSDKLVPNFGYSAGIMFNDKKTQINALNDVSITENSCFVVRVCFENLQATDAQKSSMKDYSIMVGDTISISEVNNQVLTTNKKDLAYVKIMFASDDNDKSGSSADDDIGDMDIEEFAKKVGLEGSKRTRRVTDKMENAQSVLKDQPIIKHDLYERANEKLMAMIPSGEEQDEIAVVCSYSKINAVPFNKVKSKEIYVDTANHTVLFNIFGHHYPVHVSKIKNLSLSNSFNGDHVLLRINMNCPMSLYKATDEQMSSFVKELHYKANDFKSGTETSLPSTYLRTIAEEIKELQKADKKAVSQKDIEVLDYKDMSPIQFTQGKRIQLHNVFARPFSTSKKTSGTLEGFKNGICYTKKTGERFMFPYSAIKSAIYHPCSSSNVIIALHFRLNAPIMVNNKKSEDVQFFAEAGELSTDLEASFAKRSKYNDDYHEQEMQNQVMKRLRATFVTFCKEIEERTAGAVNFERPQPENSFMAKTTKFANVNLSDNFMFSIIEWPAFILDAREVELVYFERDIESLTTCDLAVIPKDYTQKVISITTIDRKDMDILKFWLNSHKIAIFSGIQVLNWPRIMTTILEDPHGFSENGNWKFLSLETSSDEGSNSESNEPSPEESSTEDEEDDDEDDDEQSSEQDSDEDDDEEDDDYDDSDEDDEDDDSDY